MLPVIEDLHVDRLLIGRLLVSARESLGQTVRQIAAAAGLTSSHISKIELGQVQVSAENLVRVCHALALPPGLILESCAFISWERYRWEDLDDPAVVKLSLKAGNPDEQLRSRIADFVGGSALAVSYLLKSSAPTKLVSRLSFPVPEQLAVFQQFAARLEGEFDIVDRNVLLLNAATRGYDTLVDLGLIKSAFISAYLRLCEAENPGILLPWIPHPMPAFFAGEIPREEPQKLDISILIAATMRYNRTSSQRKKELHDVSASVKHAPVKTQLPSLLKRLKEATEVRGMKSQLAKFLGVPLASVSQWLSGEREPGGEVTLRLLRWVELQERQGK